MQSHTENQLNMKNKRPLKTYKSFVKTSLGYSTVPEIRLKGKWLYELGFSPSESITVYMTHGRLTVVKNRTITLIL